MFEHRRPRRATCAATVTATFALLACCATGHADPFGSAPTSENPHTAAVSPSAPREYRVAGTAIAGERAVAVIQTPDGRFRIVQPGEQIGDATVVRITLDTVHLKTPRGVSRLPVSD